MGDFDWIHEMKRRQRLDWQKKTLEVLAMLAVFTIVFLSTAMS